MVLRENKMISNAAVTSLSLTPLHAYLRRLVLWWFVPLAFLAGIALAIAIVKLQEIRFAQVEMKARNLANEVDRDLAKRLEGLRALAALSALMDKPASIEDWHRSVKAYGQEFGMPVMVVDTHRNILRHSRRPPGSALPPLPQPRGRPAFEQAVDSGQAQIGDPLIGPILGVPVVQIILPVLQRGEVLMGLVSTHSFRPLLFNETLPQGWRATLLDSMGREIASTQPDQGDGSASADHRAQAQLRTAPFRVVVDVGAATYYKESLILGTLLLFGLTLSLMLIVRGAKRAGQGLTASVRQLADPAAMPVSTSDWPLITEIEEAREVGTKSRAKEQFLLKLGDVLRSSGDARQVQEEGCEMLVEFLNVDRVFFSEFEDKADVVRVVTERLHPQAASVIGDYETACAPRAFEALRRGRILVNSDVRDSQSLLPDERRFCEHLQTEAFLGVPITRHERLIAALWVTHSKPRFWKADEIALVKEVGERIWSATERLITLEALSVRTVELIAQTRQLRWLASELTLAEHKTRELLSKALHDHLQQILFSTSLTLQRALAKNAGDPILEQAKLGVKEAMEAARSLSLEIFPPVLRSEGLPRALQWLATWQQKKYGLSVQVSVDPQADPAALDVRILLFECVRELLFNAVKHANAKSVSVELTVQADQVVQILVMDDGVGFDPKRVPQAGPEVLGLGLFSIQERLRLLGGEMRVDSAPGQGTRIALRVPQQLAAQHAPADLAIDAEAIVHESAQASALAAQHGKQTLRILLVDDHAMVRDGLRQLIMSQPHLDVVGEAVDGMEAIAKARTLSPDVVVIDRSMPVLDGIEATRRILAVCPTALVFGMSMDDGDVPRQFEKAGATGFFSKKDGAELLLQRLAIERQIKLHGEGGQADRQMDRKQGALCPGNGGVLSQQAAALQQTQADD